MKMSTTHIPAKGYRRPGLIARIRGCWKRMQEDQTVAEINMKLAEELAIAKSQVSWLPIEVFPQFPSSIAVVRAPGKNPVLAMQMNHVGERSGWYSLGGERPKLPWEPTEFWRPPFRVENLNEGIK